MTLLAILGLPTWMQTPYLLLNSSDHSYQVKTLLFSCNLKRIKSLLKMHLNSLIQVLYLITARSFKHLWLLLVYSAYHDQTNIMLQIVLVLLFKALLWHLKLNLAIKNGLIVLHLFFLSHKHLPAQTLIHLCH